MAARQTFVFGFVTLVCLFGTWQKPVLGQEKETDPVLTTREAVTCGFETDINTKYIWRGITVNDGLVIQPYVWASYRNFTLAAWGNITAYDRFATARRHEIDLIAGYNYSIGKLQVGHTIMFYLYPNVEKSPATGEFYLDLAYPLGDFSLVSQAAADFMTYFGSVYFQHGLKYGKALGEKLTLGASAVFSWATRKFNSSYIGVDMTAANLAGLNLDLTYNPDGLFYFKPHLQFNRTLTRELSEKIGKYPWFIGLVIGISK